MKYSIFALFALSVFSLFSCQNNTPSSADTPGATLETSPTNISDVAPASEPKKLSEQILTDFLEAQKMSKQYSPANAENFQMIKNMKVSWGGCNDADKAHIEKLVKDAMVFFELYQKHGQCVESLDSISTKLMAGNLPVEDAQKQYLSVRAELKAASERLQSGVEKMNAVKAEWERDFPELSKIQR